MTKTNTLTPTLHRDGTVTFWRVYERAWTRAAVVPDAELAAMGSAERERVRRHMARHSPAMA